jgi:hypothetical protein
MIAPHELALEVRAKEGAAVEQRCHFAVRRAHRDR